MTKIACVVQRYGLEVAGGAEAHAHTICERLASDLNWQVDIFTTTAKDYSTWEPFYSPGTDRVGSCNVFRYPIIGRRGKFFRFANRPMQVLARILGKLKLSLLAIAVEKIWLKMQGPWSPDLKDAIINHEVEYDFVLFFTYLYATTQVVLPHLTSKTVLVPTAHDEGAFFFLHTRRTLESSSYIFANSQTELDLIARAHPEVANKISVVGIGIDPAPENIADHSPAEAEDFVIYCGRIGPSKNMKLLYNGLAQFWEHHPDRNLKLYLCGGLEQGHALPKDPRINYLGWVEDKEKTRLISRAKCVVSSSELESLSLLTLEAMLLKSPLLLNRRCAVFNEYARDVSTVYLFENPREFADQLTKILAMDGTDEQALFYSQAWAKNRFSWQNVLSAYKHIPEAMDKYGSQG